MLIFTKVDALQSWISIEKNHGKTIGFVPTMGALHTGHISLIEVSKSANDYTLCSIFVNPTQFNDPSDLAKYPRPFDTDVQLLVQASTDILFYPPVDEIYPADFKDVEVDLNGLDQVMEGIHRPGHFAGVVKVVNRLLDIVKPHKLYMGQKDFQQFTIIRQMIQYLQLPVKLEVCPIAREKNGLAMSSRNTRLSKEGRELAGLIYQVLMEGKKLKISLGPQELVNHCLQKLQIPAFTPEYFSIVDSSTLLPIETWDAAVRPVACVAVWLEGVRLIDNEYYD